MRGARATPNFGSHLIRALERRHRFAHTLLAAFMLAAAGCSGRATPAEPTLPPPRTAIDSALSGIAVRAGFPAIGGAIIWPDSIHVSVLGVRRLGVPGAATPADRFHLGSNTKAMTATVIATLVEQGRLSWESTPLSIFPELADSINSAFRVITLAQLLSHRAGLHPFTSGADFASAGVLAGDAVAQRRAFAASLLHRAPSGPVGSFLYSNAGYALAAAMAERVTGESWETLMRVRLFAPLGLRGEFGWPAAGDAEQPWGHWLRGAGLAPHDPRDAYRIPTVIAPAGDVNMSLGDYARFVQLHLRGLMGREMGREMGRDSILTAATFRRLHDAPAGSYALGWGIVRMDGVTTSVHDGSGGTFYATVAVQPERGVAVAVVTNAVTPSTARAMAEAAAALLRLR
ncbi:MAG: serine hydrolase domain-containing protein [Gemmatimonadaceae bacterium]